jgi:hypothetical protein
VGTYLVRRERRYHYKDHRRDDAERQHTMSLDAHEFIRRPPAARPTEKLSPDQ